MAATDPIDNIIQQLENLRPKLTAGNDQAARNEALQLSKKLTSSLGHPASTAVDLAFAVRLGFCASHHPLLLTKGQPFITVSARIAINLNLFKFIAGSDGPITSQQLAAKSGGEELLISTVPLAYTDKWSLTYNSSNSASTCRNRLRQRSGCEDMGSD